jgi:hypothetical protein
MHLNCVLIISKYFHSFVLNNFEDSDENINSLPNTAFYFNIYFL